MQQTLRTSVCLQNYSTIYSCGEDGVRLFVPTASYMFITLCIARSGATFTMNNINWDPHLPCTLTMNVSVLLRAPVRNGEDTLTLQVYSPASDTRSGLRERSRELPVPDVTLPLGWINVMVVVVDSVSPPVTVAVQVRVKD